ncbi:MAG: polymer-forming cytoskeletal protein [Anaerolineaceae bacterium]
MKNRIHFLVFLCLIAALLIPSAVHAQSGGSNGNGQLVLGGTYTLASGDTLDEDLAVLGGTATLQNESTVNGDIFIAGGTLTVSGTVNGTITALGGTLTLDDNAVINGDVVTTGATLHRSENARITGSIIQGSGYLPQNLKDLSMFNQPNVRMNFQPFSDVMWFLFRTLALAALAILVTMFLPRQTGRIANAVVLKPMESIGMGLLTAVVAPLLLIILLVTIILIPVSLLAALALGLAILYGWIAMGLEVGKRLEKMFHTSMPLAVSAGLGTLVISLIGNGIAYIPCVGWLIPALISLFGLGGVFLTRLGTRIYPEGAPDAPLPTEQIATPAAPQPPVSPVPPPDESPRE